MNKDTMKKNLSSIQVLKTLDLLLQDDYTMAELIQKLNEKEKEPIFNNSVISKYINTCRYCGIDIPKIFNKYYVTKLPFGLKMTDQEVEMLLQLNEAVSNMSTRSYNNFCRFLEKINRYADKKIIRVDKNNIELTCEVFERAVAIKKQVKIMMKNREELIGIPITITTEKDKMYFDVFIKNKIKSIEVSRVSAIDVLNTLHSGYMQGRNVIFTLKEKLAKRYETRPNEKVIDKSVDGTITISNLCTDEDRLISRLMRYDDKCEIKTPSIREKMKNMINATLANYGIE